MTSRMQPGEKVQLPDGAGVGLGDGVGVGLGDGLGGAPLPAPIPSEARRLWYAALSVAPPFFLGVMRTLFPELSG